MNVKDSDFSEDEPSTSHITDRLTIDIRLLAAQTMKKMFTVNFKDMFLTTKLKVLNLTLI